MRAVLDACVLFPPALRDLLLDAAHARCYDPIWTADILDELQRNLVADAGVTREASAGLIAAMLPTFPDAETHGYERLVPKLTNHPKDRHVLAVAVQTWSDVIVTKNISDFPPAAVARHGIVVLSPDQFVRRLFELSPAAMSDVVVRLASRYRRPPMPVEAVLARLAFHMPSLPALFRRAREAARQADDDRQRA